MGRQATSTTTTDDALSRLMGSTAGDASDDALLFLGNWQGTYPALLVQDPALTANDVRVYLFIKQHAIDQGRGAARFPAYDLMCERLRIARPTLANALTRLRLMRWITRSRRPRDKAGRYTGSVYALHDEPASVVDAIRIDHGYLPLVFDTASSHSDRRTRKLATLVRDSLREQIENGHDPLSRPDPMSQRIEAYEALQGRSPWYYGTRIDRLGAGEDQDRSSQAPVQVKQMNPSSVTELGFSGPKSPSSESELGFNRSKCPGSKSELGFSRPENPSSEIEPGSQLVDSIASSKIEPGRPVLRSSSTCSKNTNTTSTGGGGDSPRAGAREAPTEPPTEPLRWPEDLAEPIRPLVRMALNAVPPPARQQLLDAYEFKQEAVQAGRSEPLRQGPVAYIQGLVNRYRNGTFNAVQPRSAQREAERRSRKEREQADQRRKLEFELASLRRMREDQAYAGHPTDWVDRQIADLEARVRGQTEPGRANVAG